MPALMPADDEDDTPLSELRECTDCGLFQRLPTLRPGFLAECPRCDNVLRARRRNSFTTVGALMVAGLALFTVLLYEPLLGIRLFGRQIETTLPVLPFALEQFNMGELSILVLTVTLIAPLLKLVTTAGVIVGLRIPSVNPTSLAALARVRAWLTPWAMTEVFLLGLFVAYTRLTSYATVQIGPALYAMGGLMLIMVAADAWLDEHALWDAIGRRQPPMPERPGEPIGCDTCGHVSVGKPGDLCPTCESHLRVRKKEPVARCWALVAAAAALYVPANILPVMTIIQVQQEYKSTIMGGVQELIAYKMWPLALIVFIASVVVPMIKLVLLVYMLVLTQRRSNHALKRRTKMYRIVDVIGRWSMIDVFMITILTALVRMGAIASVIPEPGAICFAGVVILTMLAAESFDPRVMWDVAEAPEAVPAPALAGAAA
jgi:paraquat-inducible protein A